MKSDPKRSDPAIDAVDEASEESFPASDPPTWTVATGEKGSDGTREPGEADSEAKGCAPSFIGYKRGETTGCGPEPDPAEEYVQPEKEREAGGEG